ncbi:MAG: response regulator [Deltaproteobacteria bacterium]|nr:response regulator [Deltaproteobacteria bacterium]
MYANVYITPASSEQKDDLQSILLVDDFEAHLELMTAILEGEGYRVMASSDANEVLKGLKAGGFSPDLAVLDVMMPAMSGYELCKRLKGHYGKRYFPVILVTGLAQLEDKLTGLEAGADDFFSKPFNPKEIVAKIRSLLKLKMLQDELDHTEDMIFTLAMAVEAKDNYTRGHSERVSVLSARVAERLGLPEKEITNIRKGGILHDIGKIGVHEDILHKKEALSKDELEIIRRHPATGTEICKPLRTLHQILPAIRHHHERWDGHGFPDGLRGECIPLMGRIISIVDSFDAMVSIRPYRNGLSVDEALRVIMDEKTAGQWDPFIVDRFMETVNSGSEAIRVLYGHK